MLKFSANLGLLWTGLPLPERIRAAKEAGFDAVELHCPYAENREALKAALKETGLPLLGINTRPGRAGEFGLCALPGRGAEARAAIDEAVEWAADLGGSAVHVMAGVPSPEMPPRRCREAFARLLAYAANRCGERGLTALIEPINTRDVPGYFLSTTAIAERFLDMVGSGHLKMQFDCYHAQIMEGDLTRRVERLMPRIGHIQIAAVPSRAEPDEGELSYERLLPAIEAAGYSGYIGAEYRPRSTVEAGLGWLRSYRESCR